MEYRHISFRLDINIHDKLKQEALNQKTTQQALMTKYIADGLSRDEKQTKLTE